MYKIQGVQGGPKLVKYKYMVQGLVFVWLYKYKVKICGIWKIQGRYKVLEEVLDKIVKMSVLDKYWIQNRTILELAIQKDT